MNAPTQVLAVAAVSVAATAQLMSAFGPSFYELRDRAVRVPNRQGVKEAVWVGGGLAIAIGGIGSIATRNALPLVSSLIGVGVLYASYMWAIDHPHSAGE